MFIKMLQSFMSMPLRTIDDDAAGGGTPPAAGNTPPAGTPPVDGAAGAGGGTPPAGTPPAWEVSLDKDFADILKPQADKLKEYGLAPEQAQKIINAATQEMKDNLTAIAAEDAAFEKKHGGAEKVKELKATALKAMEKAGVTLEEAQAITKMFGSNKVYEVFYNLAKQMGADDFKNIGGGSGVVYQPGNMSAEQAGAEVAKLQKDEAFMTRIANGDKDAEVRLETLINMQYGVKK